MSLARDDIDIIRSIRPLRAHSTSSSKFKYRGGFHHLHPASSCNRHCRSSASAGCQSKVKRSQRAFFYPPPPSYPAVGTKKIIFLCSTTFVPLPYRGVREGMIVGVGIKSIPTRTNTSALSLRENKSFALPVSVHRTLFDHRSCRTPIIVS